MVCCTLPGNCSSLVPSTRGQPLPSAFYRKNLTWQEASAAWDRYYCDLHVCPICGESSDDPGSCSMGHAELRPAESDEFLGVQIGAFRIARLLGSGGIGRVYLGVHPDIGSRVAIKVFARDWIEREDLVDRFFAEARATNVIQNERIVNVIDIGRLPSQRPYIVMEYLKGAPLSTLIGTETLFDSGSLQLMLDVLTGLAAAHERDIIHRDLKPDNIFVSPEGHGTLLDFGIAKLRPELSGDSAPTETDVILGTPHYMAPEQAVGDPIDVRTDIYSVGIILFEIFLGRRPFTATSLYALFDQHVNEAPPAPREIRPDLDEGLEKVILKALEKMPSKRFQNAIELKVALEACVESLKNPHARLQVEIVKEADVITASTASQKRERKKEHAPAATATLANPLRQARFDKTHDHSQPNADRAHGEFSAKTQRTARQQQTASNRYSNKVTQARVLYALLGILVVGVGIAFSSSLSTPASVQPDAASITRPLAPVRLTDAGHSAADSGLPPVQVILDAAIDAPLSQAQDSKPKPPVAVTRPMPAKARAALKHAKQVLAQGPPTAAIRAARSAIKVCAKESCLAKAHLLHVKSHCTARDFGAVVGALRQAGSLVRRRHVKEFCARYQIKL